MDISLIIPTYGRYDEINKLLESLSKQTYPSEKIEIIIIDQNDKIDISPLIEKYNYLNIIHYKIPTKGSANAKNVGIRLSNAPLVTFPDDDCAYYEDTVASAIDYFDKNHDVDVAYARIFDRETNSNIMRNWSKKDIQFNMYNFHLNYSAIACFSRKKDIFYDVRFGTGAPYFSGDELDYVITAIRKNYKVVYTSSIDIWHPQLNLSVMPLQKVFNYALGYGAICRKNASFSIFFLFGKSTLYQLFLAIRNSLFLKKEDAAKNAAALKGRIQGFTKFKN